MAKSPNNRSKKTTRKSKSTRKKTPKANHNNLAVASDFEGVDLTEGEIMAAVCTYLAEGTPPPKIAEVMAKNHNVHFKRTHTYNYIHKAAQNKRLHYIPYPEKVMENALNDKYGRLEKIEVVHGFMIENVATQAAYSLLKLMRVIQGRKNENNDGIHLGIAGGYTLRVLARYLSDLVNESFMGLNRIPLEELPSVITFHSMVAGFSVEDPTTDPNAMFTQFIFDPTSSIKPKFVALHAPSIVHTKQLNQLKKLDSIRQAFERTKDIDIVVTSLGSWTEKCESLFYNYMKNCKTSMDTLKEEGIIGDMMWRPINLEGPITKETHIRAMTIMEIEGLHNLIQRGGRVMLLVAPSHKTGELKSKVVNAILRMPNCPVSDLVIDSRTARDLINRF